MLFSKSGVTISDVFFSCQTFFLSNMSAVRFYWSTCTSSFRRFSLSFTICFRLSPVDPIFFIAVACVLLSVVLISHCASLRKHLLRALCLIFVRTGTLAGSPCNPQMEFPLRGRRTFYTWQPTTQGYSATLTFREKVSQTYGTLSQSLVYEKSPLPSFPLHNNETYSN